MRTITHAIRLLVVALLAMQAARAEILELEGTVQDLDAEARTIRVERTTPKGRKTLEFEVIKKAGDLSAVKVGDSVALSYDPDLELVTKIARRSQPGAGDSPRAIDPGPREREICRTVCERLEKDHYLQRKIDVEMAGRMLESYLRSLDPMKMYFLRADVDGFGKKARNLPSQLREGDLSLPAEIQARFLERVDARTPLIERLIGEQHDFTRNESMAITSATTRFATTEEEALDAWRRRIKCDLLVKKMEGIPENEAREQLLRRYRAFATRMHRLSADEWLEIVLSALAASFDPDSAYLSPESMANLEIGMKMQLDGIGAQLKSEDGLVTVVELTPGGAAAKDGRLKPQDRIVGIGQGAAGEIIDVQDMSLNETVNLVRGKRGTVVRLKVLPAGRAPPRVYELTRHTIDLRDREIRGEVFDVDRGSDGKPARIGVIVMPAFYGEMDAKRVGNSDAKSASRDCKALLDGFRLQHVDGIVLDLRNNGGGALHEMIGVAGLFIDQGRLAQVKHKDGSVQQLDDKEAGQAWAGPLVVLVNGRTSSAGEMLAAAIQDHFRGVLVGAESTGGNATSRNLLQLDDSKRLGTLKILWSCFYRPGGDGFQQRGVRSDFVLPSLEEKRPTGRRDGSLAFDRIPAAGFQPAGKNNDSIVTKLRRKSETRVGESLEFQRVVTALEQRDAEQREGHMSLVESEFAKQWQEAQRLAAGVGPAADAARGAINRDYYLDEVLNIAADLAAEEK